jgi:hypothetical protein
MQVVTRICFALLLTSLAAAASAQELTKIDPLDRGEPSHRASAPDTATAPEGVHEGASSRPGSSTSTESICLLVEANARANGLPVDFFARVIWQESRFRPNEVGPRTRSGDRAQGIAQFMPRTAQARRLLDPFDPFQALPKSAEFLRELRDQFGNLGLAAAAYNAGPQRVRDWMAGKQTIPAETRYYVSAVTGRSIDKWLPARNVEAVHDRSDRQASNCPQLIALLTRESPRLVHEDAGEQNDRHANQPNQLAQQVVTAQQSDKVVSAQRPDQPVGAMIRHVELEVAPKAEDQRIASDVPHWGMQLTAGFSESEAWALYRSIQKRYAELIGDREPIVVPRRNLSFGNAMRYNIRIADDNRADLEQLCAKLMSAGGACLVLRND